MNGYIKQYLVTVKGWKETTRYITNRVEDGRSMVIEDDYPSTTLTHLNRNLMNAIDDFREACRVYDREMGDRMGTTRGKVVCAEVGDMKGFQAL